MKLRTSLKYTVSVLATMASCAIAGQAVAADAAVVGNVQNARDKVSMCIGCHGIEGYKGCQELLSEAIAPYGLTPYDTHDALSIFMNKEIGEYGKMIILETPVKTGESIDLRAEMDLLIAISACPSEKAPTNNYVAKSLGIQILERR